MVSSAAIEEALLDVAKDHIVAGAREHVRDTVAHGSRAENRDRFDLASRHELPMITEHSHEKKCSGDKDANCPKSPNSPRQPVFARSIQAVFCPQAFTI